MYLTSELSFLNNGKRIFGELYLPSIHSDAKIPIVIISHGFGSNSKRMETYAKIISNSGFAVYTFDFIGGGDDIRSDGNMMEMSVLTEVSDLELVLNEIIKLPFIDTNRITLMGLSQGGFVSTYVGCKNQDKIKNMVLLYPAFNINHDAKVRLEEASETQNEFRVMDQIVSRKYGLDAISFDIFDLMKQFEKKVFIIHGDKDEVVNISYSERAVKEFKNATLYIIKNAGHGFKGGELVVAAREILNFLGV